MISYAELKAIAENDIFDNFWQLLNYPRCDILSPTTEEAIVSGNPFKGGSAHTTTLNHTITVEQVRCIYNEAEFDVIIGSSYEKHSQMLLYILAKDLPAGFKIKKHYKIRFNGENHNIQNVENIINTIFVITLD